MSEARDPRKLGDVFRRKIRIQIPPSNPRAIADVVDPDTGEVIPCKSIDLHADHEGRVTLTVVHVDFEADVIGTWECRLVREETDADRPAVDRQN